MQEKIRIAVNGFNEMVQADISLAELIEHFNEGDIDLIVELNGRFVYPQTYDSTRISGGDHIEFINPNFGG